MHKVSVVILIVATFAMLVSPAAAQGHRVGAGIGVMAPLGDMDDGAGVYGSYMFDISDMLATYVGVGYFAGDYDIDIEQELSAEESDPAIEGTQYELRQYTGGYESTLLEAALVFQWQMDALTPYAGVGGGYNFISFDDMNVGDKLSLFYTFGLLFPVGENLSLEASARINYLRPRSYNPDTETVDMDSWVFRLGVTWDL